jgi:putative ABC transport system ATP-binding protein
VAIARALVHEPNLLVCDEPTAALDAQSGQTVMQLLRRVALQPQRAVIVVTHDNRVFGYGDRIIHMDDGIVTQVETPDHTATAPQPLGHETLQHRGHETLEQSSIVPERTP